MKVVMTNYNTYEDRYLELGRSLSANNDTLHAVMFLVLVGALANKRGILVDRYGLKDLRMHPMLIQPTRTGKGEALKVLQTACGYSMLSYTGETQFTDAGAVGKINSQLADMNRKKGLLPNDPDYIDPVVIGDFGLYDVIAFPEGKQMIKTGAYSDDKLEILQNAMDFPGRDRPNIRKKLADEIPLEYKSNSSFIGTTYYLDEFGDIFLQQGIFQRMFVSVRHFNLDNRRDLNKTLCLEDPPISPEQFEDSSKIFCDDLLNQVLKIPEETVLKFTPSGRKTLAKRINEWTDRIEEDFVGTELDIMGGYTTSDINLYSKIAGIVAILNGKKEVRKRELDKAHSFVTVYMNSIMHEVLMKSSGADNDALSKLIVSYIKRNTKTNRVGTVVDGTTVEELYEQVRDHHPDISETRVVKITGDLVDKKVFREIVLHGEKKIVR